MYMNDLDWIILTWTCILIVGKAFNALIYGNNIYLYVHVNKYL